MSRSRRNQPRPKFMRYMQTKLAITFGIVVLALFALCGVTIYYNVFEGDKYTITVLNQQEYTSKVLPYKRGEILDRNGNSLATSIKVYNLVIDSKIIMTDDKYIEPTVNAVAKYFESVDVDKIVDEISGESKGINADNLTTEIKSRKDSSYWVVIKQLTYDEVKEFQAFLDGETKEDKKNNQYVKGVWFEEEYKRMYPFDNLACSVVGFTNKDGSADVGIESYYNNYLTGINGREYGYVNADSNMESVVKDPTNGNTVVSTIDVNVQRIVQEKIKEYMEKFKPQRLAVVIADPNTGEILAMADDKTFDLNNPRSLKDYYSDKEIKKMSEKEQQEKLNEIWRNYCVSDSYEPGSTAKPFTVATAYEEGLINDKNTYVCDGSEKVGGFTIHCHKVEGHGTITAKQAVAYSCNDAMMQIAAKTGAKLFTQYQTRFGFGFKTGIDLPSETRGLVYDADMGASSLATNSFGQNFTVNMIQMVSGFSSLVNGGYYYEPHVVKEVQTEDGNLIENYSKSVVRQTVTSETSEFIKECLRAVVTDGTGTGSAISGYTVGGKTGTAEKVDTSGNGIGRLENQYILSFLGCVPCEDPKVVCYTLMDTPEDDPDSTAYNTEFWSAIMKEVLPYLHIEKTEDAGKDEDIKGTKKSDVQESYDEGIISGDDGSLVNNDNNPQDNSDAE